MHAISVILLPLHEQIKEALALHQDMETGISRYAQSVWTGNGRSGR